jgi:uncharacterized protein YciI
MKYVLVYETAEPDMDAIREHFPAHRERWARYQADGSLLAIGPYSDLTGALGVFTTREAAEDFVAGDPFVTEGIASSWRIHEWNEVLLDPI